MFNTKLMPHPPLDAAYVRPRQWPILKKSTDQAARYICSAFLDLVTAVTEARQAKII